jgi:hypothetical protein
VRGKLIVGAAVGAVAVMVINPGIAAYAKQVFTGDNIIDGSLTGADIQDGSLQAADLAPGAGSGGGDASTLHTWTVSFTANGQSQYDVNSQELIPAGTLVQTVDLDFSGMTAADCNWGANVQIGFGPEAADRMALRYVAQGSPGTYEEFDARASGLGQGRPLHLMANCYGPTSDP